jgi:uncharacterized membrane protein
MAAKDFKARRKEILSKHYGENRSRGDVLADKFVKVFGSWSYIIWQTVFIIVWMLLNVIFLKMVLAKVPDPYPFILLNLGFSAQASYAAPLILMAQNRGAKRDKDFATHQFEIIENTHEMLKQNNAVTEIVRAQTAQIDHIGELLNDEIARRVAGDDK